VFEGGAWVFPGGRIDHSDYPDGASPDTPVVPANLPLLRQAAINAAIRETREEAGLDLNPEQLIHIAHWTTPMGMSRRYATWFFLCPLQTAADVVVDSSEILDHQWITPAAALEAHSAGRLRLPVPTQHTLKRLAPHRSLTDLCAEMRTSAIHIFPENSEYCPLY
ncbi:MAG TPA: NUDIX hydrolase, partial [Pseudohongiella sp.]|nr:NUDIX hydrolase [Pseudohongiella sp.]